MVALLSLALAVVSVSSAKIPVSTTEMTLYRNESSLFSYTSPFSPEPRCALSNQTLAVHRSLSGHAAESKSLISAIVRVAPLPNVAAVSKIRPTPAVDMIENAYLFLACLVMLALVNVIAIDYAYGGPLFVDDSLMEETLFASRPIQYVRPVSLSVAAPTIAPANPIHSSKWSTVNKSTPKTSLPIPISAAKSKPVSRKEGSDTEC